MLYLPTLSALATAMILGFSSPVPGMVLPSLKPQFLSNHQMPLSDRQPVASVNSVFRDNILLTLAYLDGQVRNPQEINWEQIRKIQQVQVRLYPGQTFAFHNDLLPQYQGRTVITTNAHFTFQEGFESDGYLAGDGVCHLASLIYWAAKDAGLEVLAPTNHNFANIPDIPKEDGVAIYSNPTTKGSNAQQNLYVTNNQDRVVTLNLAYQNDTLTVSVTKDR